MKPTTVRTWVALPALLALGACAPLQQAALIYSSKQSVGIDVAAATADTPGGSISIGVKIVDAAYVPVAVSKKLRDGRTDSDIPSEIVPIRGRFGEGSTVGNIEQLSAEDKQKIADYLEHKARIEKLTRDAQRAEEAARRARDSKARFQSDAAALGPSVAADDPKRKTLDESVKKADETIKRQSDLAAESRKAVTDSLPKTEQLAAEASEAFARLDTERQDALSVFGRFDSNARAAAGGASSPSANLTTGKIFSTGVASQNLTEAVLKEALLSSTAACLAELNKLLGTVDKAQHAAIVGKIEDLCPTRQRKPGATK